MANRKIGVFIGSLRKESFSRKVAIVIMKMFPAAYDMEIVEIGDLALYNQDIDDSGNLPPAWTFFREKLKTFDAFLFVTPEYNRSVPGGLKNALDVGSRPYGKNLWNGKPAAVVSVSTGTISGFGANHHLRQSLVFVNVPTLQQPEVYIGNVDAMFNEQGELINDETHEFLEIFMKEYMKWIEIISPKVADL